LSHNSKVRDVRCVVESTNIVLQLQYLQTDTDVNLSTGCGIKKQPPKKN